MAEINSWEASRQKKRENRETIRPQKSTVKLTQSQSVQSHRIKLRLPTNFLSSPPQILISSFSIVRTTLRCVGWLVGLLVCLTITQTFNRRKLPIWSSFFDPFTSHAFPSLPFPSCSFTLRHDETYHDTSLSPGVKNP